MYIERWWRQAKRCSLMLQSIYLSIYLCIHPSIHQCVLPCLALMKERGGCARSFAWPPLMHLPHVFTQLISFPCQNSTGSCVSSFTLTIFTKFIISPPASRSSSSCYFSAQPACSIISSSSSAFSSSIPGCSSTTGWQRVSEAVCGSLFLW